MPAPRIEHRSGRVLRHETRARRVRAWMLALALIVLGAGAQTAYAQLTISPTTWNVIGLDSNRVTDGPNVFPVGARVCNTSGSVLNNVVANFVWDSNNTYINLTEGSTLSLRALSAGACTDFYFNVTVTRSSSAYNQTRRYHITATADGVGAVSTPTPREIYVEKLVSQSRNEILSISGPTTVYVGNTYNYTVNAKTATGGYEQIEAFLHLSNIIFQVQAVSTTYTAPPGGTNDKFYADACGWDNNPLSPSYRTCIGPANYPGGKAGDQVSTTYTVKVLSTGTTTISSVVYDFSGSSYHYNGDFGQDTVSVTSLPPPITLSKSADTTTLVGGGTLTYTLRLTNTSGYSMTINDFVDTLPSAPANATYVNGSSTFNNVSIPNPTVSGSTLTWTGLFVVPAGQTRDLKFQATLPSTPGTYVNSAIAHIEYAQIDTTSAINDNSPATVSVQVIRPPDLTITKSHTGNFTQGQNGTYTLTVSNSGDAASSGAVTVSDTLPASLTPGTATGTGWTCSTSGQTVTCTRSDALNGGGSSYPSISVPVTVSPTAPASVTNTATVSGGNDSNPNNNSASDPTTINPVADMTINKTHAGNFTRGLTGAYTITATNSGLAATNGTTVTVTDTLPAGLTPTLASGTAWTCGIASQTVTCTRTDVLNAGASYPAISVTVTVAQNAASSVTNTATVSGGGQAVTTNDSSDDPTTVVSSSDLSLTKTTNNSGSGIGTNATFTVTVTNAGPSDATNVAVRDQLPAGLTYVSSTPSVGTYNSGTGICSVGNLASGANATLQLVARVDALGALTNTAQVSASDQPDPDSTPNNSNATEDDQASSGLSTSPPSVSLCKTIEGLPCPPLSIPSLPPGSDISYVVAFTNTGGTAATSFIITDPSLPPVSTLKLNDYTYFKVGSIVNTLPAGLNISAIRYSNDAGATWTYTPASGAGGAPAGYDANVTHIRWEFSGSLSHQSPNNTGSVGFTVRIK